MFLPFFNVFPHPAPNPASSVWQSTPNPAPNSCPKIREGLPEIPTRILLEILARSHNSLHSGDRNFEHKFLAEFRAGKFGEKTSGSISGERSQEYSGRVVCGAAGRGARISGRNFRQALRNLGPEFGARFRSKPPAEICR